MSTFSSIAVTSSGILAVGTNCGRVCVYKARSMELVKIAVVAPSAARLNALASTDATFSRRSFERNSSAGPTAVLAMQFIYGLNNSSDLFISALIEDGSICVVSVPPLSVRFDDESKRGPSGDVFVVSSSRPVSSDHKSIRRIPSDRMGKAGLVQADSSYDFSRKINEEKERASGSDDEIPYFCSCVETQGIFGVLRGDILDVFSVSGEGNAVLEPPFHQYDHLRSVGSPVVSRLARVRLLDGHCAEPKKGNPRAPRSLHVYDVTIRRTQNSRLLISAVGASAQSTLQPLVKLDMWLLIGQLELNAWSKYAGAALVDSSKLQNVAMFRRVSLGLNYHALSHRASVSPAARIHHSSSFHPHYKFFNSSYCHVFTAHGLVIIDVRRVIEKTDLGRASDHHLPDETRESFLNGQELLSISSVSIGSVDFSTLCGNDATSAVPGDNHRPLSDHAVLSFGEPRSDSAAESFRGDILDIERDEVTSLYLSRSLSTNTIMKVQF